MSHSASPDFTRVFDILEYQLKRYPQTTAVQDWKGDHWKCISIQELINRSEAAASWLVEKGYQKGDCIAIVPRRGSSHWLVADFAVQMAGMITVPIHPTSSIEEMLFILEQTSARLCLVEDHNLKEKIEAVDLEREIFVMEPSHPKYFPALQSNSLTTPEFLQRKQSVSDQDVLAILYTSGTTGISKGAVLTHDNVVSNIKSTLSIFPLEPHHRVLSFLPISHIFERTTLYVYLTFGVSIYFNHALQNLSEDFQSVKPFFCTSVPRTLEKMYDLLSEEALKHTWWKRKIIMWAMNIGERFRDREKTGWLYALHLFWARFWVLRRWRKKLGGELRYVVVGAAALRPEIARLFSAAGITTLSGYGMTEASPFIAVNRTLPGLNRFGTVGLPLPGVEVMIDSPNENGEGEILVRGPNIIRGYFHQPDLNKQLFSADGWFRTGDVGTWEDHRFLKITDRKKDIFKTSAGKYIAPQPIESYFATSPFISQCMIIGFNRPFVVAVLVPNFYFLERWCESENIHWTAPSYMIHNIKIVQKFQLEVDRLNHSLEGFKQVKKFVLADNEWTVENKDLTASFKLVRSRLLEKYKNEIEKLYQA